MKKYNVITGIIVFLMIIISVFIIIMYNLPKTPTPEFDYLKDYKDNEYLPVYISEEKMAKIYYNDYMFYINYDIKSAYELLNKNYRDKKFKSMDEFKNYVEKYKEATLESYSVDLINKKKTFSIKLTGGLELIFATEGVMKYEMYLDEFTTDIE